MFAEHERRIRIAVASLTVLRSRITVRALFPRVVEKDAVLTGEAQTKALPLVTKLGVLRDLHGVVSFKPRAAHAASALDFRDARGVAPAFERGRAERRQDVLGQACTHHA